MKRYEGLNNYIKNEGTILILGMFDGMHLGHRALFKKAHDIKGKRTVTVLTFGNHFKGVKKQFRLLMTAEEKAQAIENAGADELILQTVDVQLMNTTADRFIDMLKSNINIKGIVVGFDYTFGKNGAGNVNMLKEHFDSVYVVDKVEIDGDKVSSTALRKCIADNDMERYIKLCGTPYVISGNVCHGNCIGRQNQTPTINICVDDSKLVPEDGVYITKIKIRNKLYESISNLGSAPTFERESNALEVHVFDFNECVYDEEVVVTFYKRIREVRKFDDCKELYSQIFKDIEITKNYFRGLK